MLNASKAFVTLNFRSVISRKQFIQFINMSTNVRTLRTRAPVKTESESFKNGSKKRNFITAVVKAEIDNSTVVQIRKKSTNKKTDVDRSNSEMSANVCETIPNLENTEIKHTDVVGPKTDRVASVEKKSARKRSENVKKETENCRNVAEPVEKTNKVSIKSEPLDDTVPDKEPAIIESVSSKIARKWNTATSIKSKNKPINIKIDICDSEDDIPMDSPGVSTEKSPRKRKQVKNEMHTVKGEKNAKTVKQEVKDIEDAPWEPTNWKPVWENILKMRKMHVAPVDSLGCEECPDKGVSPEVHRYQTLISVMLSSQTRDEVTYAATQRLIEHGLNVDSILKTPDEKIGELIYPAGFWKSKVQYIKRTTQILKDEYKGDIPRTFKELIKLPGVGPKMANIVMSVGWNDTVGIAVDTHVHRISNRLGWVKKPTKDPEQTRKALESWLPKELWKDGSFHMVGFGQTVCKPVNPKCYQCFNVQLCPFGRSQSKIQKRK